jgi:Tfp pilus assembly protein PilW
MDEGIELGIAFLVGSIIIIGIGYYYFTKKLPKE